MPSKGKGWHGEPARHSAAARGINTVKADLMVARELVKRENEFAAAGNILRRAINQMEYAGPQKLKIGAFIDEIREKKDTLRLDSPERKALEELEWVFVQLADDPDRLLREKWGFKPKSKRGK